jgi:hypothetical protein
MFVLSNQLFLRAFKKMLFCVSQVDNLWTREKHKPEHEKLLRNRNKKNTYTRTFSLICSSKRMCVIIKLDQRLKKFNGVGMKIILNLQPTYETQVLLTVSQLKHFFLFYFHFSMNFYFMLRPFSK